MQQQLVVVVVVVNTEQNATACKIEKPKNIVSYSSFSYFVIKINNIIIFCCNVYFRQQSLWYFFPFLSLLLGFALAAIAGSYLAWVTQACECQKFFLTPMRLEPTNFKVGIIKCVTSSFKQHQSNLVLYYLQQSGGTSRYQYIRKAAQFFLLKKRALSPIMRPLDHIHPSELGASSALEH